MTRPAALFSIALALGATILVPAASAREPTPIKACQTISKPGSYELANNLTATGDCLLIATDFVTIDLAGFLISGAPNTGSGIRVAPEIVGHRLEGGVAVRNGSISGFAAGVDLSIGLGPKIVEGLRVLDAGAVGIVAEGIVKGNTVTGGGTGIAATGTVTGNYAAGNVIGFDVGGTVIGNTALITNASDLPWGVPQT
jgi:hypothetical protein